MAQKILIMGESGTGKSTSLRHLAPTITAVVNPVGKPLPFKDSAGKFTMLNNETRSSNIVAWMKSQVKAGKKILIVDDFQYLLSIPYMNRIHEGGWDKWNDFGDDYFKLIDICADLPADVRVYYLSHCETLDNGITTIKLIGKLLREKITIEGLFTIVLRTSVIDQKYYFLTQNSGKDTVKSPIGMFAEYAVENDLAYIDDKVCNYYEIGDYKSDAEMIERDQEVASGIARPNQKSRRARGTVDISAASGEKTRKTRKQVEAENKEKMDQYMEQVDEAVTEAAGGREEIPIEEAFAASDKVPVPDLEKPPRRTRREREAKAAGNPADQFMDIQKEPGDDALPMNPPEEGGGKSRERKVREIQPAGYPAERPADQVAGTQTIASDEPVPQLRRARRTR
ncbi:MAG: ATP-binding protein [Roseburia sp.]|nr:ATP-binding protein [Roseburia sp.]